MAWVIQWNQEEDLGYQRLCLKITSKIQVMIQQILKNLQLETNLIILLKHNNLNKIIN